MTSFNPFQKEIETAIHQTKMNNKTQILRAKLETAENSPLVENFDTDQFLQEIHRKHTNES